VSPKADLAVDFHDRDTLVEPRAKIGVGVHVEANRINAVFAEQLVCHFAQMAPCARVEYDAGCCVSCFLGVAVHRVRTPLGAGATDSRGSPTVAQSPRI